jgi:hypothetical protein
METKLLEIRDRATFIPAMAIRVSGADGYLLRRAGFVSPLVILIHLQTMRCQYDPDDWNIAAGRTMPLAHKYIEENWSRIAPDSVVDMQFILGETKSPKQSEEKT